FSTSRCQDTLRGSVSRLILALYYRPYRRSNLDIVNSKSFRRYTNFAKTGLPLHSNVPSIIRWIACLSSRDPILVSPLPARQGLAWRADRSTTAASSITNR
ncbi:hypothetical protein JMJ77_0007585, partial [Colletotrichum scovillei]